MRTSQYIACEHFPCPDVNHTGYILPEIEIDPGKVSIVLISEAAPPAADDYYYASGSPLFAQTTVLAFQDAGAAAGSLSDVLAR